MLRVFDDLAAVQAALAGAAADAIVDAVAARGFCTLVLSGGDSPRGLYTRLAAESRIPWDRVHVFWSDERYVPPTDPQSNYRMARELLLDHVPCPAANVHAMPTHVGDAEAAAVEYEATLRSVLANRQPLFDLSILGIGPDGHTASLFPGSSVLGEQTRLVRAVTNAPAAAATRLTLTLPALASSARTCVLVTGAAKADALHRALTGPINPHICPASALRRIPGVDWWADRSAAARMS
jgi:6-phosphogluconolactonase